MGKIKWRLEKRRLRDLKEYGKNPRVITEKKLNDLKKSLDKFSLAEPIVINTDGTIIGGHARYYVLREKGQDIEVDCMIPNRTLSEKEIEELNLRLNKNIAGDWDWDKLANEFDIEELIDWGFDERELAISEVDILETEGLGRQGPDHFYSSDSFPVRIGPILAFIRDQEYFKTIQQLASAMEEKWGIEQTKYDAWAQEIVAMIFEDARRRGLL